MLSSIHREAIKTQLAEENPEAVLLDEFDQALIGIGRRLGCPSLAVYNVDACIDILTKDMDYREASEYFDFNVANASFGEHGPILVNDP